MKAETPRRPTRFGVSLWHLPGEHSAGPGTTGKAGLVKGDRFAIPPRRSLCIRYRPGLVFSPEHDLFAKPVSITGSSPVTGFSGSCADATETTAMLRSGKEHLES